MSQAVTRRLEADFLVPQAHRLGEIAQVVGWLCIGRVFPDADVADDGGQFRLALIGGARQQRHAAISGDNQALKKAETEGVVAG